MSWTSLLGKLLHLENVNSIDHVEFSLAAPWAHRHVELVVLGCVLLSAVAIGFYWRYQGAARSPWRLGLAVSRALVLSLLLVCLAEPVLLLKLTNTPRPWLWVLFDGSESMALEDEYMPAEQQALAKATGTVPDRPESPGARRSRVDHVRGWLNRPSDNLFTQLGEKYRLKGFVLDRADGVRELAAGEGAGESARPEQWARDLPTTAPVTALGRGLEDLKLRHATGRLAGLMVVSDFGWNSGPPPGAAARKLGVPVYTVGVGAAAAIDLAVELESDRLMKKGERGEVRVRLTQTGLSERKVTVKLSAKRVAGPRLTGSEDAFVVGQREVELTSAGAIAEFPFTPSETGRLVFTAEVEPIPGELVAENNRAEREAAVHDDFLRLMFVEYEPTWEWRFIKEVFYRDPLVGMQGFRTFLRSADPNVRKSNELFLPTLTPKRSDFFANDVIFLGDMPGSTLSPRFFELTKEFVERFGGGLVVMAGPRFGPSQLVNTPLAEVLPVVLDPGARVRDERPFPLKLTAEGQLVAGFMRLGSDDAENHKAWNNLGALPWYQPVSRLASGATALAVHPTDTCIDGRTPQPLIAIRQYGRGYVVYLAFNETWRLRRKYGELYFRQFWGQMIHQLGRTHALGTQKRFVVSTDRQQYQPDDKVIISVEAYDANFEPLADEDLPEHKLTAELTLPLSAAEGGQNVQTVGIPQLREGVFEARLPVFHPGTYRLAVQDPVTRTREEIQFDVQSVSVERRTAVRQVALERELAAATAGRSYDLTTVPDFLRDFQPKPQVETLVTPIELWNTWLCFGLVVALLLLEWVLRKWMTLP